ncbi:MAG: hypothetical protein GX447_04290 [Elusimicrobia bacterium]|nr:hypothetical protein [Elusimicrobiota bacterium]
MKKIILPAFIMLLAVSSKDNQFSKYEIEGGYFSCLVPSSWDLKRDKRGDEEYKTYEIKLNGPGRTWIYVSYYSKDNEDFKDYKNYIDRNTKDGLGRKNSDIGKYSDAKPFKSGKIKGFEIIKELKEYVSLESKSSDAYWVKERIAVIPAKEGFFVLSYSAKKSDFEKYHPVYKKVLSSFIPGK